MKPARTKAATVAIACLPIILLGCPNARRVATAPNAHCAGRRAAEGYGEAIERGRQTVRKLIESFGSPGMAIAVSVDGNLVWSETFGHADVKRQIPVCPSTRFRIASLSKPITAAAVALLYEAGKIDLDAPVQRYAPGFPDKGYEITTRQLLGHLAGIRSNRGNEPFSQKRYSGVKESLEVFKDDPLLFPPGERFSYSNYGYVLLGAAIEGAAGEDYAAFAQRRILDPLGMRGSTVGIADEKIPDLATFYEHIGNGVIKDAPYVDYSRVLPSGGFISTAEDLARFGDAHLQGDFLKPQTVQMMFTPQETSAGTRTTYGLGWGEHKFNGRVYAYHTGHSIGAISCIMIEPGEKVVVVMLSNLGMVTARVAEFAGATPPDPAEIAEFFIKARKQAAR